MWNSPHSEIMTKSGNVGNVRNHLVCRAGGLVRGRWLNPWRVCVQLKCDSFLNQFIFLNTFGHRWLYNKALTSLTRDSPRCRLPRVEIFPVPMKRDEVSSKAEISAIRFSFCAKVFERERLQLLGRVNKWSKTSMWKEEDRDKIKDHKNKEVINAGMGGQIIYLLLHPVEQVSPLPTKSLQGSSSVSVAASLSSHLTSHPPSNMFSTNMKKTDFRNINERNWTLTSHLKPLKMSVLFRHGAAQGLLSGVGESYDFPFLVSNKFGFL